MSPGFVKNKIKETLRTRRKGSIPEKNRKKLRVRSRIKMTKTALKVTKYREGRGDSCSPLERCDIYYTDDKPQRPGGRHMHTP